MSAYFRNDCGKSPYVQHEFQTQARTPPRSRLYPLLRRPVEDDGVRRS